MLALENLKKEKIRLNQLTKKEKQEGWNLLFNGVDIRHWKNINSKNDKIKGWGIVNESLAFSGRGGSIISKKIFSDFILKLEWKISPKGNSGIFFKVQEKINPYWKTGVEMQVLDNNKHQDGKNILTSAGAVYGFINSEKDYTLPVGQWNKVRVIVVGNRYQFFLNNQKTADFDVSSLKWNQKIKKSKFASFKNFSKYSKGGILLQDHGDKVWYRNIKIKNLTVKLKKLSNL